MDMIKKEDLDSVDLTNEEGLGPADTPIMTKDDIKAVVKKMDQPVELQKDLAARLKLFLDKRIREEMKNKGYLSDFTRRWVKEYNDLLDRIHRNLYGDKSVHLHLGKVTHAHIASAMREYEDIPARKEVSADVKENKEEEVEDE